uniref:P-type ATPase C-terminal domain-containing protein n=1 Tax=Fundulus heteroclitus TaxID=8078 RepID=A0A3Q2QSM9_FUNHE
AFVRSVMISCYTSLVLFFIPWAAMHDTVRDDGKDIADYQSFALLTQTCLLIVVSAQVRSRRHHRLWNGNMAQIQFSGRVPPLIICTARNSLNQPNVWLTMFLTCLLCVIPLVAFRFLLIQLRPTITDKVRRNLQINRKEDFLSPAPRRPPARRISTRRSSYAFSHSKGYGDLVTSRKFLRLKRRPSLFTRKNSALVENQPQLYRTITEEAEETQNVDALRD